MDQLFKLVKTYRLSDGLAERLRLAESIFRRIEPDLRLFVFASAAREHAEDALQETLKAVATDLGRFRGDSEKEFWAWCYRIARNKVNDSHRKQAAARTLPLPPDELLSLLDASAEAEPLSAESRHDLEQALRLLTAAKPECAEYLWRHFVIGLDYAEIADHDGDSYDAVRMRIGRCLETAQALVL